jgi:hypothetical protein
MPGEGPSKLKVVGSAPAAAGAPLGPPPLPDMVWGVGPS